MHEKSSAFLQRCAAGTEVFCVAWVAAMIEMTAGVERRPMPSDRLDLHVPWLGADRTRARVLPLAWISTDTPSPNASAPEGQDLPS